MNQPRLAKGQFQKASEKPKHLINAITIGLLISFIMIVFAGIMNILSYQIFIPITCMLGVSFFFGVIADSGIV